MSELAYLKVKIKSLAEEIRIIRNDEHKTKRKYRKFKGRQGYENAYDRNVDIFWGLRNHRKGLSLESRDSHLAYAFVRGQTYRTAESTGYPIKNFYWCYQRKANIPIFNMDLENIARLASKYGVEQVDASDIEKWILADEYSQAAE